MQINIKNEQLDVCIGTYGAELLSVRRNGKEYMWRTRNNTWSRTSPVLFPITGRFPDNVYTAEGEERTLPLNGFAREMEFAVVDAQADSVCLRLLADEQTLKMYPYHFQLDILFQLIGNELTIGFEIVNRSHVPMPFSVGYHPGFNCFLPDSEPWSLRFEQKEHLCSFSPFGWHDPFLTDECIKTLSKDLFDHGARTVTGIRSDWVELVDEANHPVVRISRSQFPFLSMWTLPDENARFVCIEPSLSVSSSGPTLLDRAGICILESDGMLKKSFCIAFF